MKLAMPREGAGPVLALGTIVVVTAVVVASLTLWTLTGLRGSAQRAARHSREAVLTAEILRDAEHLQRTLLAESARAEVSPVNYLTAAEVLDASLILAHARASASELHSLAGTHETLELWGAVHDAQSGLEASVRAQARVNDGNIQTQWSRMNAAVDSFARMAQHLAPEFASQAQADNRYNEDLASTGTIAILSTFAVSAAAVTVSTWYLSRRMKDALQRVRTEKAALIATTQTMERRNGQFRALYQIVTEVSETLSMKYVVETTVREARKLVAADITVLRLLRGDQLEVAGTAADDNVDVSTLQPVQLGQGLCGRAAKRGKSILVHNDVGSLTVAGEGAPGVESGLVVPLIVGARVVGTMGCWSRHADLFTEDDQQVLEMMATQVASAVAAADTHRVSEELAHTDTLTGLPNRRQLARDTQERFEPALAGGRGLAVAMIDIDHFKRFNDEFGHKTGDITLQKVASVLRASLREEDRVYRYGGEEFTVVFEDANADEALRRAERVRVAVERTPLTGDALQPVGPVTISIGLADQGVGQGFDVLLKLADEALYQAKWEGRNRVAVWTPGLANIAVAA